MQNLRKKITTHLRRAHINLVPTQESPDELLGELFQDVQFRRIFPDGMTFVDMVPAKQLRKVLKAYRLRRHDPDFDLAEFVQSNFMGYMTGQMNYQTNPNHTIEEHIEELWPVLTREIPKNKGSLIGLPYPFVVAGGRFIAQFYWDSYFTLIGLAAGGHWDMVENTVKNQAFLIRKLGFIPNGNRTYYTRSQPPVFALNVRLLAQKKPRTTLARYLPYLTAEYAYWMRGSKKLTKQHPAHRHVVRMPDGSILNRYFDSRAKPRPESYKEDVDTALRAKDRTASKVYLDLRAGAESGWDYTARWLRDPMDLSTIHTTDIVPIDLNCLLVVLEQTIAEAYIRLKQQRLANYYLNLANKRIKAIHKYLWDAEQEFFIDYDFVAGKPTGVLSAAATFALWTEVATQEQADGVAHLLQKKFLHAGGLVNTLYATGQQWDWPNGWAPLHWTAIQGLRSYGHVFLADEIKQRWVKNIEEHFRRDAKLVEKYNVIDPHTSAGGGEYALQDGFGWTNGVLLALLKEE
ncbi:MAG TPA: alpha,alpha-trehalase TreF [Candidatus Saccharimonadales bacterium]|nr:alpha,alpha-trehalase TreF [Candidatus Saccharimonadales bacterium]